MSHYPVHIPGLLKPDELREIGALAAKAEFVDGKTTASAAAKKVKSNLQIDAGSEQITGIRSIIDKALKTSPLFGIAALPKTIHPFVVSKYAAGNVYGWHVDNPWMGDPPLRTDLAMTIFLSAPSEYEGGELVIQTDAGPASFKPAKGDAILYPCQYVHGVNPVLGGTRLAAVTWIQSNVRSSEQRQILFQLNQVHAMLHDRAPNGPETTLLLQTHSNLFRMWCDG